MKVRTQFPHQVLETENCWITMSDGCRLAARIWLPEGAERRPVPAILEYLPYRKRDFTRSRDEPMHRYFAGFGYAAVRVDLRGSGDSDGTLEDEYTEQEQIDALETIAWIASQPWCDGSVGMMGISWGGFNSLQVAARRPPALKSIITLCSTDDRYADDAHYMGGCLLNENLIWGSVLFSFNAYPPDPEIVGEGWRETWLNRLENASLFPARWMRHPHRDEYWKHGSVCEDYAAIECPVYAIGGWADGYSNAVPRLIEGLKCPRKGLIGPWAHAFPHQGVPGPAIGFLQEALRWWDHWLRGVDTGIMDEPIYRVWMQESARPKPFYRNRPGRWVAEESWPSPRMEVRRLFLNSSGLGEESEPEKRIDFHCPTTTGIASGDWCAFGAKGEMPIDQRPDDGRSLCFDSEPLPQRLEILGAPEVLVDLAVDRPNAMLAVRLNDVDPSGASTRVTYGLLNLTHRGGHESPQPIEPGRKMSVRVRLNHIAHAFAPGHTLRVAMSASYWPLAWPSPDPVTMSVYAGAGVLELPVRPPRPQDDRLRPFDPPERAPSDAHVNLRPEKFKRTVSRDLLTNQTTYKIDSKGGEFEGASLARLEAINLDVGYRIRKSFRIGEEDPNSAAAEIDQRTRLERDGWAVRIHTRTRLESTRDQFHIRAELDAYENGVRVFSRNWDEEIDRDFG